MTVDLNFAFPENWVPLPFDDVENGAVLAAQLVMARYEKPVPRPDAVDLEQRFRALAELMIASEVDVGFALVPLPPRIGLLGALFVRWRPAAGDDAVADAVADSMKDQALVDVPDTTTRETALGTATRCIHRYYSDQVAPAKVPWWRKIGGTPATAGIVEHICWYWRVSDPDGPDLIVTVTSSTNDLSLTPFLRTAVDAFAEGVSV
jgi:hypothetical protein